MANKKKLETSKELKKRVINKFMAGEYDGDRQSCEVWTRVMGYHRPVSQFNPGKKSEHNERKHFVEMK